MVKIVQYGSVHVEEGGVQLEGWSVRHPKDMTKDMAMEQLLLQIAEIILQTASCLSHAWAPMPRPRWFRPPSDREGQPGYTGPGDSRFEINRQGLEAVMKSLGIPAHLLGLPSPSMTATEVVARQETKRLDFDPLKEHLDDLEDALYLKEKGLLN